WIVGLLVTGLGGTASVILGQVPEAEASRTQDTLPMPQQEQSGPEAPASIHSILDSPVQPIDLASALQLAGVQNPEILLARERVVEAVALRQLAAAQILPNINVGTNFDNHNGPLQRSTGAIQKVNRGSLY